ncbi:AAA family ATPase [Mycoplasma seminis]|uniref:AAA family ATPase n=1 Tax=Mycoplasma seminis TaxID=512749 RepID=A0ABY9H9K8_9MOLU|nr:AAA family ATPase [Mycoplasma seminis]WLP85265.1 AAA family ATPase [Mycoplasma seminis]
MNNIKIKHYWIQNFKGVAHFSSGEISNLKLPEVFYKGENGIGKTTALEAITYLFVNKGLDGKRLNPQNKNSELPPVIELTFEINGNEFNLAHKDGKYFINDVAYTSTDYFKRIKALTGVDADLLLAIISPQYFIELEPVAKKRLFLNAFNKRYLRRFIDSLNKDSTAALLSLRSENWNTANAKKEINKEIKEIQQNMELRGFPAYFINKVDTAIYNRQQKAQENKKHGVLDILVDTLAGEIITLREQNNLKLLKLYNDAFYIDETASKYAQFINTMLKSIGFGFNVELFNDTGKDVCNITWDNVPFNSLNSSTQTLVAIQLSQLFQTLNNMECFILLDNAEHIDKKTLEHWGSIWDNQFLITKVDA